MKRTPQTAWKTFRRHRSLYFVYPAGSHTERLVSSGRYGVVQLICIEYTARAAFMAGVRAGRRLGRSA